jgi:Arc/MetJ-type ribon-helix-helix transcriptional regulator
MEKLIVKCPLRLTESQRAWIDEEVERRKHGNYATNRCNRGAVIRELIEATRKRAQ